MSTLTESDGSTSSRRVAAFVFPSVLYLGGIVILFFAVLGGGDNMWPVIGGCACLAVGVLLQLWLFNLINATNLAEIAQKVMPQNGSK